MYVCVYVCMYVYVLKLLICVYLYIYIYIYMYIYIYRYKWMSAHLTLRKADGALTAPCVNLHWLSTIHWESCSSRGAAIARLKVERSQANICMPVSAHEKLWWRVLWSWHCDWSVNAKSKSIPMTKQSGQWNMLKRQNQLGWSILAIYESWATCTNTMWKNNLQAQVHVTKIVWTIDMVM